VRFSHWTSCVRLVLAIGVQSLELDAPQLFMPLSLPGRVLILTAGCTKFPLTCRMRGFKPGFGTSRVCFLRACHDVTCTRTYACLLGKDPPPRKPTPGSCRSKQKNLPVRLAVALTQSLLALTSGFWTRLLEPFTVLGLRSAVRSRKFWERGLARAW